MPEILVVDDDESIVTAFRQFLTDEGQPFRIASSGEDALRAVRASHPDLVIMDIRMPGMDGLATLDQLRRLAPETYVVIMTAYGTSQTSIEAMRLGAFDYLSKPLDLDDLRSVISRALAAQRISREARPAPADDPEGAASLAGKSARMLEVYKLIGLLATNDVTPLIVGERGTGKQLVAHTIHVNSPRRAKPFLALACGALPSDLVETEIFGSQGGTVPGRVDTAEGGTLFLSGVEAAPPSTQAKLARLMIDGSYRVAGGLDPRLADVRVVVGAEGPLRPGTLDPDLYEHLSVIVIELPPLRERPEDIPDLVSHFVRRCNAELGRAIKGVDDRATRAIEAHPWPGNVAELQTLVKRACILARGDVITLNEVESSLEASALPGRQEAETALQAAARTALHQALVEPGSQSGISPFRDIVHGVEATLVHEALVVTGGNQVKAAELLGLNRATLRKKMKGGAGRATSAGRTPRSP